MQLGRGAYLGFRAGPGTWIVRYRDRDGRQQYRSLGIFDEFTKAKERADRWLDQIAHGAHRAPSRGTVRDALASYVRNLRSVGRRATAWDVGQRFRLTVGRNSAFGRMRLEDIRREDVEQWRDGLRRGRLPRSVNRQVRAVMLSDEGIAFFRAQARGKFPKAPLISGADGGHWRAGDWSVAIRAAASAANASSGTPARRIPAHVSAYSFRHSRISELLQVYGIDPLTVAQQCGTSMLMIEKYYFKFISSAMREKLNSIAK